MDGRKVTLRFRWIGVVIILYCALYIGLYGMLISASISDGILRTLSLFLLDSLSFVDESGVRRRVRAKTIFDSFCLSSPSRAVHRALCSTSSSKQALRRRLLYTAKKVIESVCN